MNGSRNATSRTAKIIIPDNPPPHTISEYNIGDFGNIGIHDKVEFVGSFIDTTLVKGTEEHVFAPISGPYGTRAKLTQLIIPVFKELNVKSIISLGVAGEKKTVKPTTAPCTRGFHTGATRVYAERENIVFSGGHITCFETVKYAKPSVCVPTQPEQLANGMKLQDMHCSLVAKTTEQLKMALRTIEQQSKVFRSSVEKLNEFSNKFNGLNRAAEIIEETLK